MYARWSTLGIRTSENTRLTNFLELRKGEVSRIHLPRTPVNRGLEELGCSKSKPPHLPARASSQGVCVGLELLAQLPAPAEQLPHPGHLSPRLLCLLVLPRPQREELPGLFGAPNQNEGLSPFCVIQ